MYYTSNKRDHNITETAVKTIAFIHCRGFSEPSPGWPPTVQGFVILAVSGCAREVYSQDSSPGPVCSGFLDAPTLWSLLIAYFLAKNEKKNPICSLLAPRQLGPSFAVCFPRLLGSLKEVFHMQKTTPTRCVS